MKDDKTVEIILRYKDIKKIRKKFKNIKYGN